MSLIQFKNRKSRRKFQRVSLKPNWIEKNMKISQANRKRMAEKSVNFNKKKGLFVQAWIFIFLLFSFFTLILLK